MEKPETRSGLIDYLLYQEHVFPSEVHFLSPPWDCHAAHAPKIASQNWLLTSTMHVNIETIMPCNKSQLTSPRNF